MNQMQSNANNNMTPSNSGYLENVPCLSAVPANIKAFDHTHGQVFYEDQASQMGTVVMQQQKARSRYVFSKRASQPLAAPQYNGIIEDGEEFSHPAPTHFEDHQSEEVSTQSQSPMSPQPQQTQTMGFSIKLNQTELEQEDFTDYNQYMNQYHG